MKNKILLSFDVEEFDMPFEYKYNISIDKQLEIGINGLNKIKKIITDSEIKTTLFTTAFFAQNFKNEIMELSKFNEIASHTHFHSDFKNEHLISSKSILEEIINKPIYGLRMPRMKQVDINLIKNAGYIYDASVHPTYIPGRYNNLKQPRKIYVEKNDLIRIPASVSPILRIPLFWLSFKNFPFKYYLNLALKTLNTDNYISLYFHPWEFVDINNLNLPKYTRRYCEENLLIERLVKLITLLKSNGEFITMNEFCNLNYNKLVLNTD